MFSRSIFRTGFKEALEEALNHNQMSLKELASAANIPPATLYKISSGTRDPRLSTVKAIVNVLEPFENDMVAIIAAKFLLDELEGSIIERNGRRIKIKGYTANTMEECIVAAVKAEKEGAAGIICAPILATLIEKIVDIPVVIIRPDTHTYQEAIETLCNKIE
jgi:predicted transcriptional regulator